MVRGDCAGTCALHPNAAAAFGSHARPPRVGPALGTPACSDAYATLGSMSSTATSRIRKGRTSLFASAWRRPRCESGPRSRAAADFGDTRDYLGPGANLCKGVVKL